MKTFPLGKKKEANAFAATAIVEIRDGTHVADSASVTVKEAGHQWIATAEADGLERTTIDQYRHRLKHIEPLMGRMKLSQLNAPVVRRFEEALRAKEHSPTRVKYVVRSLGALLADAQESGLVVRNAVRELSGKRRRKKSQGGPRSQRGGKLQIGVDIPTKEEIRVIINAAEGRWRPLLLTAIFTGLRASELRGLRWSDVDFEAGAINVTQRADRFNKIGPPKTRSAQGADAAHGQEHP
jgi:integrase